MKPISVAWMPPSRNESGMGVRRGRIPMKFSRMAHIDLELPVSKILRAR